jgi:hypothetical protein
MGASSSVVDEIVWLRSFVASTAVSLAKSWAGMQKSWLSGTAGNPTNYGMTIKKLAPGQPAIPL